MLLVAHRPQTIRTGTVDVDLEDGHIRNAMIFDNKLAVGIPTYMNSAMTSWTHFTGAFAGG